MSWKSIVAGTSSELLHRLGDLLQPLVRDLGDGDVGLDRRERVVAGLGAALGQGVEEGRLARVRQADDSDLHQRPLIRRQRHDQAEDDAEQGAGEDVGRVVHAEVGTAEREREGDDEGGGHRRVDPDHRRRHRERGGGVGGGEAERAGRAAERRQALEHRPRPLHRQLDRVVEADREGAEQRRRSATTPSGRCRGSPGRRRAGTRRGRCCRPCRGRSAASSTRACGRGCASSAAASGRGRASAREDARNRRHGGAGRQNPGPCRTSPASSTPPATTAARPRCATCSPSTGSRSARRWPSGSVPAPASTTWRSTTPRPAAGSTAAPRGWRRASAS